MNMEKTKRKVAIFFILPSLLVLLGLGLYPLLYIIYLSLHKLYLMTGPTPKFVGFSNYYKILFQDPQFYLVLRNTIVWVLGSTACQFLVAFPTALILNSKVIKLKGFFRGIILIPWVMPIITVGIVWRWIYNADWGILNYYLFKLGVIKSYINWLGNQRTVWPALLIASTWKGFPYMTLMFLAGLQGIPPQLYEAAKVDGANNWNMFKYITLPLMKQVILVVCLVASIQTWNNFRMIWVLTQGGPGYTTTVLSTYIYMKSFSFYRFGEGATVAVISLIFVVIMIMIYLFVTKAYRLRWR